MSLTISPSIALPQSAVAKPRVAFNILGIPLYVFAVTLASVCTVVGIMWDISWHITIGRDGLFSPPHVVVYMGAVLSGLFSGIQVLYNSFAAPKQARQGLVRIWGIFYSSLGALFSIWGAIAMLTSAPFDDWWHNAYGLDVVIISPPHSVLGIGILFLQFGAVVSTSKYLNKATTLPATPFYQKQKMWVRVLFIIAAACLIGELCTFGTAFLDKRNQRTGQFYIIAAAAILLFLPAFARELRLKYSMTLITIVFFLVTTIPNWVMQLVPATPKLGPILNHVTHLQALQFPMLLFVPAFLIDLGLQKIKGSDWVKAAFISVVFVLGLLAVQYPFSGFLQESPGARNWVFGSQSWYYGASPDWEYRYKFMEDEISSLPALLKGVGIAIVAGFFISRLSLRWGKWLQNIQR